MYKSTSLDLLGFLKSNPDECRIWLEWKSFHKTLMLRTRPDWISWLPVLIQILTIHTDESTAKL